jgi:hypothetical protein
MFWGKFDLIVYILYYHSKMPIKRYHFYNNIKYIDYNLKQLPIQLRNKLFILCMRFFWRHYIPLTGIPPTWYYSAIKQKQLLFNAKMNNIHFLHLPCNTLKENKSYIVGCQCSDCSKGNTGRISIRYMSENLTQYYNENHYHSSVPLSGEGVNDVMQTIEYESGELNGMLYFNPNYDIRIVISDEINGPPIYFT